MDKREESSVGEFDSAELRREIKHDYSSSREGIVPMEARKPQRHFIALWITFAAGLAFIFQGFTYYSAGFSMWKMLAATTIGSLIYIAYATPSAYLGSRTGQTYGLLTRSIFGVVGSVIVSLFVVIVPLGWVGFQANLLAQMYDGLLGWGSVVAIGVFIAVIGITNNVLGFTGVTVFARYVGAPLIILWIGYLVIKGLVQTPIHDFSVSPKATAPMTFVAAIVLSIGFVMWGNEADVFRYGQPRFFFSVPAYAIGLVGGQILFPMAGWIIANRAGVLDFGPSLKYMTEYSLFGVSAAAFFLFTIQQIAINDGNYYETTNAGQNLIGGWHRWTRVYTCLVMAVGGGFAAWLIPHVQDGFFKIAGAIAVTIPTATVIMCVDHFVIPRLFGVVRPNDRVPSWREAGFGNWPGIVSLLVATLFGAWATGILPGQDASELFGIGPLEAWLLGGALYLMLVWIAVRSPSRDRVLGFAFADQSAATTTVGVEPTPAEGRVGARK